MITVLGKVKDKSGLPLEGVNIYLFDNANVGTTTNESGEFFFEDLNETDLIIFSYQGQEVILEAGRIINEVIIDTVNVLDEVVVTSKPKKNALPYILAGVALVVGVISIGGNKPKKVTI